MRDIKIQLLEDIYIYNDDLEKEIKFSKGEIIHIIGYMYGKFEKFEILYDYNGKSYIGDFLFSDFQYIIIEEKFAEFAK